MRNASYYINDTNISRCNLNTIKLVVDRVFLSTYQLNSVSSGFRVHSLAWILVHGGFIEKNSSAVSIEVWHR